LSPAVTMVQDLYVKNLKKYFKNKLVLSVPQWELHGAGATLVLGPNGAGKTTFLRILAQLLSFDEGEVSIPAGCKRSFYESGFFIFPELTVGEHFSFLRQLVADDFIEGVAERFDLPAVWHQPAIELSRGWKARLGLALACSKQSQLYLFDEPMDALDKAGSEMLLQELHNLHNSGRTLIIATHRAQSYEALSPTSYSVGAR
ncbi:MAG: ABC transporter ATP-binding protein, partial [Bdellovibrionales bacterium]|nr:ABC transporter ATP-binding protein [Bdellovibrionales bacterium]